MWKTVSYMRTTDVGLFTHVLVYILFDPKRCQKSSQPRQSAQKTRQKEAPAEL